MDGEAVVAFVEIVDDELPVGIEIIGLVMCDLQVGDAPGTQAIPVGCEAVGDRLGRRGEIDKEKTLPFLDGRAFQGPVLAAEIVGSIVHTGSSHEPSTAIIGPAVIPTLDESAIKVSSGLGAQNRSPVAADVVVGLQLVVFGAHENQIFAGHLGEKEVSRIFQLLTSSGADPVAREDFLSLQIKEV